jgi:hypothetical protein
VYGVSLCCPTSRFSITVIEWKRTTFWNVRARPFWMTPWLGTRSTSRPATRI